MMEASRELADSVEMTRENAAGLLPAYVKARDESTSAKKHQDRLGDLIKHFLEQHPEEVLWDGENEIEATLQTRSLPGREYDLATMWEKDRIIFERLVLHGCLKVDEVAVKRAGQNVGGVDRYAYPQRSTTALKVERKQGTRP